MWSVVTVCPMQYTHYKNIMYIVRYILHTLYMIIIIMCNVYNI